MTKKPPSDATTNATIIHSVAYRKSKSGKVNFSTHFRRDSAAVYVLCPACEEWKERNFDDLQIAISKYGINPLMKEDTPKHRNPRICSEECEILQDFRRK